MNYFTKTGKEDVEEIYDIARDDYKESIERFKDVTGYRDIEFGELPDIIGGVTIPYIDPSGESLDVKGGQIIMNDKYLENPGSEENFKEFLGALFHESGHLEDFRLESEKEYGFTKKEREYKTLLSEGLSSNLGLNGYPEAEKFYSEFFDRATDNFYEKVVGDKEDMEYGEVLEEMSEERYLVHVGLDTEEDVYDFQMLDRELGDLDEEEIYDLMDEVYNGNVDREKSYLIDFREEDIDADKIARHYLETHERVENNILNFEKEMKDSGKNIPSEVLPYLDDA